MKRSRPVIPLQERRATGRRGEGPHPNQQRRQPASSSDGSVKSDVKAALRTAFGRGGGSAAVSAGGDENEKQKPPVRVMTRSRLHNAVEPSISRDIEKSQKAGIDRIGPATPIGKLSLRIKRMKHNEGGAGDGDVGVSSAAVVINDMDAALVTKLSEAQAIFSAKGIHAARKFMDAFPSIRGMGCCRAKLAYWNACITFERSVKEWDRVAECFERARVNVTCMSELQTLQSLFEEYEKESDDLYEEERQRLDESILDTLSDSEDLVAVMAGRYCTNAAPRLITAPAPKTLLFVDDGAMAMNNNISKKRDKKKPRMRF